MAEILILSTDADMETGPTKEQKMMQGIMQTKETTRKNCRLFNIVHLRWTPRRLQCAAGTSRPVSAETRSLVSVSVSVSVAVAVCLCLCPSLTRGGYTGTYAQVVAHEATCTVLAASRAPAGSDTTPAGGPAEWGKDLGGLADWQVCVSVCLCVCVSASAAPVDLLCNRICACAGVRVYVYVCSSVSVSAAVVNSLCARVSKYVSEPAANEEEEAT